MSERCMRSKAKRPNSRLNSGEFIPWTKKSAGKTRAARNQQQMIIVKQEEDDESIRPKIEIGAQNPNFSAAGGSPILDAPPMMSTSLPILNIDQFACCSPTLADTDDLDTHHHPMSTAPTPRRRQRARSSRVFVEQLLSAPPSSKQNLTNSSSRERLESSSEPSSLGRTRLMSGFSDIFLDEFLQPSMSSGDNGALVADIVPEPFSPGELLSAIDKLPGEHGEEEVKPLQQSPQFPHSLPQQSPSYQSQQSLSPPQYQHSLPQQSPSYQSQQPLSSQLQGSLPRQSSSYHSLPQHSLAPSYYQSLSPRLQHSLPQQSLAPSYYQSLSPRLQQHSLPQQSLAPSYYQSLSPPPYQHSLPLQQSLSYQHSLPQQSATVGTGRPKPAPVRFCFQCGSQCELMANKWRCTDPGCLRWNGFEKQQQNTDGQQQVEIKSEPMEERELEERSDVFENSALFVPRRRSGRKRKNAADDQQLEQPVKRSRVKDKNRIRTRVVGDKKPGRKPKKWFGSSDDSTTAAPASSDLPLLLRYQPSAMESRVRWWTAEKRSGAASPPRAFDAASLHTAVSAFRTMGNAMNIAAVTKADEPGTMNGAFDLLLDTLFCSLAPLLSALNAHHSIGNSPEMEPTLQRLYEACSVHTPMFGSGRD